MALPRLTAALAVLFVFACGGGGGTFVVDAADKNVLVTASELLEGPIDSSAETFTKTRDFDGAWNLEYAYETDTVSVVNAIFIENDASDAGWVMMGAGLIESMVSTEGMGFEESSTLCTTGDERKCGFLTYEGVRSGFVCNVRDDNVVVTLVVGGVTTEEAGGCDGPVGTGLDNAKAHTPSETPTVP